MFDESELTSFLQPNTITDDYIQYVQDYVAGDGQETLAGVKYQYYMNMSLLQYYQITSTEGAYMPVYSESIRITSYNVCYTKLLRLINYESDADYNRTVVTLVGEPEPMVNLILKLTEVCLKEIDLNHHTGEHARMGAVDVVP